MGSESEPQLIRVQEIRWCNCLGRMESGQGELEAAIIAEAAIRSVRCCGITGYGPHDYPESVIVDLGPDHLHCVGTIDTFATPWESGGKAKTVEIPFSDVTQTLWLREFARSVSVGDASRFVGKVGYLDTAGRIEAISDRLFDLSIERHGVSGQLGKPTAQAKADAEWLRDLASNKQGYIREHNESSQRLVAHLAVIADRIAPREES